jgi:Outer membrane protein Omp28/Secretion system C-terminal sorting domain
MNKLSTIFATCLLFVSAQSMGQSVVQKVLIEQHTGAWCGYCPDGSIVLTDVLANQPNAIGVAVHNGDAMVTADGNYLSSFYVAGYPQATINREGAAISRSAWASATSTELMETPTVSVGFDGATWNASTMTFTVTVRAEFVSEETGNLRLNVMLVEDDVTGSAAGYSQTNYYDATAGHPMYGLGNPIASGGLGSVYTHTYTRVFPATWDVNNMKVVAFVSRYNGSAQTDREILNSEEGDLLSLVTANEEGLNTVASLNVYPNPTSDRSNFAFTLTETGDMNVEIVNLMGQKVKTIAAGWMVQGMHTLYWNLDDANNNPVANGIYLVKLTGANGQSTVQRLSVTR